ncbi:MAG: HNH endonuclease [Gammaproteobacteria bacterium]|nr:HNH endonuclease [Gammaproteobacteria bacterium]
MELFAILVFIFFAYLIFSFVSDLFSIGNERRERKEQKRKLVSARPALSAWITEAGIDLKCARCLSSAFRVLKCSPHGLSFEGQCTNCGAKKWFKATRTSEPFDFPAYGFSRLDELDVIISKSVQPADDSQEENEQTKRSRHISESVRHEVWRRDQGRCCQCGSKENIEFDHIIPFSKGGSNTARNIQLLCESCNAKKRDRI